MSVPPTDHVKVARSGLFVCINAVGNLDVQQSMVWIDGAT